MGGGYWNRSVGNLFYNSPSTKKCSTHGGWIMKQVPKQPVSEFPLQQTGGGILKQVPNHRCFSMPPANKKKRIEGEYSQGLEGGFWNRLLGDLFHNPPSTKKASTWSVNYKVLPIVYWTKNMWSTIFLCMHECTKKSLTYLKDRFEKSKLQLCHPWSIPVFCCHSHPLLSETVFGRLGADNFFSCFISI